MRRKAGMQGQAPCNRHQNTFRHKNVIVAAGRDDSLENTSCTAQPLRRLAYSPAEAARAIGIGRTKFYALINEGHFRPRKIGRRSIVLTSELEAYLAGLPSSGAVSQ